MATSGAPEGVDFNCIDNNINLLGWWRKGVNFVKKMSKATRLGYPWGVSLSEALREHIRTGVSKSLDWL